MAGLRRREGTHTQDLTPPPWWARRAGLLPHPGPHLPRSLPPVAWGAGMYNGSQGGGGGHQMSPPPHSPRWRPGPHPGAGGRGTGLGPHHHHRGLHHPTHSQRRPGTWKGQRGCEGSVTGVGQGGAVPAWPGSKSPQTPCWAVRQRGREDRKGGNHRAHSVRAQKIRGHSSLGTHWADPPLPRPCPLRGVVCSTFASSIKSSEFNCTQLWSAPSSLSTPFWYRIFP